MVELQWNLASVPFGFEESELVLSLDGGRTFPVRVTGDFDPATRRVFWRVPALPTDRARLAVRAGADEEPAQETLLLVSPPFVISDSAPDSAPEELFAVGTEWRTQEALEVDPRGTHDTGVHDFSTEQIHAQPGIEVSAQDSSRSALLPDRLPEAPSAAAPRDAQQVAAAALVRRPCPTPLRE